MYFRFGVQAITIETLKNNLLEGIPIHVFAGPGGLYVKLDQERLKKTRVEQNISLGTFARHVNISRRTVQMYEEDGMNARIDVAIKIEELLQSAIATPIDILKKLESNKKISSEFAQNSYDIKDFQKEIFSLLQKL